jgi:hypothetical protein
VVLFVLRWTDGVSVDATLASRGGLRVVYTGALQVRSLTLALGFEQPRSCSKIGS